MNEQSTSDIDHYIWVAYYIKSRWDSQSDSIYATDKETAQERVSRKAGVENDGWEKNEQADYPLYQRHDTDYHIITVVRKPVFGNKRSVDTGTDQPEDQA